MSLESTDEFDPGEELSCFEPGRECYGLSERIYFYLIVTCKAIESFGESAFLAGSLFNKGAAGLIPVGFFVEFIIHQAFSIQVTFDGRLQLWAYPADDVDGRGQYLVHDGDASDPKVWEGLLVSIGRVEKFGVYINHADRLRLMWSEWLVEQKRRRDERGW
jgi:hypothetical protein